MKAIRIFAWSRYLQKLVSVGAIRRFIFSFLVNQNFRRHRKVELLRKWIALVLQVKFRFRGLPNRSKRPSIMKQIASPLSPQLIVLVFTKQSPAERYLANIFLPVFLWTFRKFLRGIKKTSEVKSYFSKVAGFYRSSHWRCSVKKDVLRKMFAKFTGKQLWFVKFSRKLFYRTPLDDRFWLSLQLY